MMLHFKNGNGRALLYSYLKQLFTELHLRQFRGKEHRVIDPIARRMNTDPEQITDFLKQASALAKSKKIKRHQMGDLIRRLAEIRQAAGHGKQQG